MKTQLHVGKTQPTAGGFRPVVNQPGGWHKPFGGGLWTSTYDAEYGSGWVQWCLSEDFGVPPHGWLACLLKPDPAARVLTVRTLADLRQMCGQYAMSPCRGFCQLNFEAMAQDFDAVRLTDAGQWATRLPHPHSLYGWDVESTLWLQWRFVSVEFLGTRKWELVNATTANCMV